MGHEDLLVVERFLDSFTPRQEVFAFNITQIVSVVDRAARLVIGALLTARAIAHRCRADRPSTAV